MALGFGAAELAEALRQAVLAQDFGATADALRGGAPLAQFPSLDLAVVAFVPGAPPVWANVLFSREHPQGLAAGIPATGGALNDVRFDADLQDADGRSIAWLPDADWTALPWRPLTAAAAAASGMPRFVAPYPASLIKLMVLVAVARLVDQERARWDEALCHGAQQRPLRDWAFDMMVISCNRATSALVALLHQRGAIVRAGAQERHNEWHAAMAAYGLPTLRLAHTRADGGWGNAAGAGVGQLQMTAWDTVRLLWLLDEHAPPPPWLAPGLPPLLAAPSRAFVLHCLAEQGLHELLSSSALAGLPGWVPGLPARLPRRWLLADGGAQVGPEHRFPGALEAHTRAELLFAHKTGNTENYSADAGIVRGIAPAARRHYLIALTSNLGSRYAPHPLCASSWRIPALGAAVDGWLRERLG